MCLGVQCPWNQESDEGSLRAEITGGCKLSEWVLGTKLESFVRAVCALNPGVITLTSDTTFSVNCQLNRIWNRLGDRPLCLPVGDYTEMR